VIGQRPADDPAAAKVDDHGKVEPAFFRGDMGDVPRPNFCGFSGEGLIEQEMGEG